jgi:hypothetical protein
VRQDLIVAIELEFAPAVNANAGFPGQGSIPAQSPFGSKGVSVAIDTVQIHADIQEEPIDQADHLLIAIAPPKFTQRVFEVNIFSVDAVGLVFGKAAVIFSQRCQDIHSAFIESTKLQFGFNSISIPDKL